MSIPTLDLPRYAGSPPSAGKAVAARRGRTAALAGAAIVILWIAVAIAAPVLAPYDPNATILPFARVGEAAADGGVFWLGTDHIGRDILSRVLWGSRTVLLYASLATASAYAVGIAMGLAAGYLRGWVDALLSFLSNVILSFPVLVLYILVIATLGASALNIVLAIIFSSAPSVMRIVRGLALDLRNREYVAAAQARGEGALYVMYVELLPNLRGPLVADLCLRFGYVTITIGALGFLGLGLPPPDPDWGGMVNEARSLALVFPHMTLFPCLAISSLVLGFNLLADGLGGRASDR